MKSIVLMLLVVLGITVQESNAQILVNDANAEVRSVDAFSGVELGGGISAYISQGKEQAVAVSAEDAKNVAKIKTEVRNGILRVYVESGVWNSWNWGNKKIKAYITVTELSSLRLSGGAVAKITDEISITSVDATLSGGSILHGKFKGNSFHVSLSGGSIANLEGSLNNASFDAGGGSIVNSYDAEIATCSVHASGGSVLNVNITKELSAEASGGSVINYKGGGIIRSVDASGGSIIKKKDR